ncbi:hypothetical protein ElyMa_004525000 [Elysia marginata]|uniref:Uncharacterized protein n=1 Tax=Elysia marginata TaxID=1093978 RepID=A0AAV4HP23_9GAST|nr:hypothetical protein ElyMa_004525000 [Elysia marginata]
MDMSVAPLRPYPISYDNARKLLRAVYRGDDVTVLKYVPKVYNPNQMFYVTVDSMSSTNHLGGLAVVSNSPNVLKALLRVGLSTATTNGRNMNLFSEAASVKGLSSEIVDMLFVPENRGDFLNDQPLECGYNTPAHLAVLNNNSYLLHNLLHAGGSTVLVATLRNASGDTALSLAIKLSRYNGGSLAHNLASHVRYVTGEYWRDVVDGEGYNALELSDAHGLYDVSKILIGTKVCDRGTHYEDDDMSITKESVTDEEMFSVKPKERLDGDATRYQEELTACRIELANARTNLHRAEKKDRR